MKASYQAIAGIVIGASVIIATLHYAPEYLGFVSLLMVFVGVLADNQRLRKKLRDLGYPDDIKARYEAQQSKK